MIFRLRSIMAVMALIALLELTGLALVWNMFH